MRLKNNCVLITAGGTGGHVYPALAVALSLRKQGADIVWMGTRRGIEARVVPENDFHIEWITIEGLKGKDALSLLSAPFKLARALWQSYTLIRKIDPDLVIGFGGFVSGPGGLVASLSKIPLIIHEQNSVVGLTNMWLAKRANRVLTGFPHVQKLPQKGLWVGNPVRQGIEPREEGERNRIRVLVLGGSQGAHSLNMAMPNVFNELGAKRLTIKHQAGSGRSRQVNEMYQLREIDARVVDFIDDMAQAYQWADLLICRAGAMTITEACAAGKPAILVPFPNSAGDHQIHNAMTMVDAGAGEMVLNHNLESSEMYAILRKMTADRAKLRQMGENAKTLYKPDSVRTIVNIVEECINA